MKSIPNIAIVILAAGASKRMGSPKQLLKWGNDTLLNHAIKTVLEIDAYEVIVVLGANHKLIEAGVKHRSITILNNEDWDLGLGKSIACATEYVLKSKPQVEGILITLADQPLIDSHYLNDIMTHFYQDLNQIIATSYDNNKGVPVLFGKVYFQELSNLTGDNGAKQLLKTHESCVKTFKPPVKNVDLDSKEDYEKLYRENFKTK
ncbi:nucleotidyltransferase family protein [uncultured Algibacter sp.]|uniref:nucleotidyltransferase family protein n=1 Tax=uncultured Algibacter sp. TaxID=298659 RepID=UPI002633515E|nr:nucleotidyltransferase family protein [uncultured Algibacter sp.]